MKHNHVTDTDLTPPLTQRKRAEIRSCHRDHDRKTATKTRMVFFLLITSLLALVHSSAQCQEAIPISQPKLKAMGFSQYQTTDTRGRKIDFYVGSNSNKPAPLIVYFDGSGCQSAFTKYNDMVNGGLQSFLLSIAGERAHVMIIEKPGVRFLDTPKQPGSSDEGRPEFLKQYTPDSWADASIAAIKATWNMKNVDRRKTLLIGISEGSHIASHVAAHLNGATHVAILSCGGPSQLFDLVHMAGQAQPGDEMDSAADRIQSIYDEWKKIQAAPDSIEKTWMGHPYRRWSSFLPTSVLENLTQSKCKILAAHGTEDTSVPIASHDLLVAQLRAKGRQVVSERLVGLDHGFAKKNAKPGDYSDLDALLNRVLAWFLE